MTHLHNHSQYSVIDGHGLLEKYIQQALADGQEHLALTDHGTLGGAIEFYQAARKHDLGPVIGCEMYVDAYELRETNYPGHLTVLATNEAGYRDLVAAVTLSHSQFYYRPRITLKQLMQYSENWIVLSGCPSSVLLRLEPSDCLAAFKELQKRCYTLAIEVMWHKTSDLDFNASQQNYLARVAQLKQATDAPLVLTNDCHYVAREDEDAHRALLARLPKAAELEFQGEGFYLKSREEMQEIARVLEQPSAWANAQTIGAYCSQIHIPEADALKWYVPAIVPSPMQRVREIAEERLTGLPTEYRERYEYELSVLATSEPILNSYLVAHDLITWCKERDIPMAARGSMAGSLVSWLLGITVEDPVYHDLSFKRAVSPARPSIPDFDMDVSSKRRQEVLVYLRERYEQSLPIMTYTHYGPRGALRKILRAENRSPEYINNASKGIRDNWGDEPERIPERYREDVESYEGFFSTSGVHPAGIIVGGPVRPLEREVPKGWVASSKTLASQYDMYTLKKLGLFKLDVLGLAALDQMASMEEVSGAAPPKTYDDPQVFAAFSQGALAEIFQMDGYACRGFIKTLRFVNNFEDIVAINTLVRPGAMGFQDVYQNGYHTLIQEYPAIEHIIAKTRGLILYQEQVMDICEVLADFNDIEVDNVKEAIKYFRADVFEEQIGPAFKSRCEAKGIDPDRIWRAIKTFSGYSFNRAHAVTYAAIAYKMMWYKVYHPAAYYAAVYDASEEKARLINESAQLDVVWHQPDINRSEAATKAIGSREILLGFSSIKGIGEAASQAILAARPYASYEDFLNRVQRKKCNINSCKLLVGAGAFEELGEPSDPELFEGLMGFRHSNLDTISAEEQTRRLQKEGVLAGRLERWDVHPTKKGDMMVHGTLHNKEGEWPLIVWPDAWQRIEKSFTWRQWDDYAFTGSLDGSQQFIVNGIAK